MSVKNWREGSAEAAKLVLVNVPCQNCVSLSGDWSKALSEVQGHRVVANLS